MSRVKEILTEKNTNTAFRTGKSLSIDTGQLEYTFNTVLTYGGLVAILATLSITYVYLLVQKIKA